LGYSGRSSADHPHRYQSRRAAQPYANETTKGLAAVFRTGVWSSPSKTLAADHVGYNPSGRASRRRTEYLKKRRPYHGDKDNALCFDRMMFARFKGDVPASLDDIHIVVYA